jgi:hypothetical protein
MANEESAFGSLSSGQLLGDTGGGPTPPKRPPWLPILVIGLIAAVALVMVAGAAILLLAGGDESSSSDPPATRSVDAPERPAQPAPEEPAPEEPARPERPSILSPAGTAEALRAIRAAAKGRDAITLRVDPDGVTAIVKGKVLVYRNGEVQTFPGPPSTPVAFSLGDVDDVAPSRINRAVREKGKQVEYLVYVANPITGDRTWTIVTKDGKNYSAGPAGRRLCALGQKC